jgi:imidazoleglycerol-phosphate dehydratase
MSSRITEIKRVTNETNIELRLNLDGKGSSSISTGIGFLDHMLDALTRHGGFDLELKCVGDLEVDDHHTTEDCALAIGEALDKALGDRRGITRFGYAYAPLDEALARAVVDLSGRPTAVVNLDLEKVRLGNLSAENASHVIISMATAARATIHVDVLRGSNDHHRAEAAFKALALALKQAVALSGSGEVPSTKGVL